MRTYKVEVIKRTHAAGRRWGVVRYEDGRRCGWALPPQDDKTRAYNLAKAATLVAKMTAGVALTR